jgi:hypothetical protein
MRVDFVFLPNGDLQLDARTFNAIEFQSLEATLQMASVQPLFQQLPADAAGRDGRRYLVPAGQVGDLEGVIDGKFSQTGGFLPRSGRGRQYACREIALRGQGTGCENMTASNDKVALTKCALIANKNQWFGGVHGPGACP